MSARPVSSLLLSKSVLKFSQDAVAAEVQDREVAGGGPKDSPEDCRARAQSFGQKQLADQVHVQAAQQAAGQLFPAGQQAGLLLSQPAASRARRDVGQQRRRGRASCLISWDQQPVQADIDYGSQADGQQGGFFLPGRNQDGGHVKPGEQGEDQGQAKEAHGPRGRREI